MKSPGMKMLGMLVWLITALAAINIGMCPFGYNLLHGPWMMMNMPGLIAPLHYIIGVAGVISLLMLIMAFTGKCPGCGKENCSC